MIAILGGLGAAAAWAISTLCSSRSSRVIDPTAVVAWVMLVGLVITAPIAVAEGVPSTLHAGSGAWLLLSGAGNVAGLVLTYAALRIGQVGIVAPVASTEGAIAAVIALLAGETIAPSVGVTLLVIVAGIGLASIPPQGSGDADVRAAARASHLRTVWLAALAAASFGASLYATGRAGESLPAAWVVLSARLIGVLALTIPLALAGRLGLSRRVLALVLVSGICEVAGFFSFTAGARHGIAIAAVLSSQFAALAGVAAYGLFGERLSAMQVAGVCTVVTGVAVLAGLQA
jgi:drug/metabolite transporter (DMT)-like permease